LELHLTPGNVKPLIHVAKKALYLSQKMPSKVPKIEVVLDINETKQTQCTPLQWQEVKQF